VIFFADINQNAQDTVLDDNIIDDFILLSVENHDVQDFDEVKMFGLDFGRLFREDLLEGEYERLNGGVDFDKINFGLELDGRAGGFVELSVFDNDHQQKFGQVSFHNSRYDGLIVGITVSPYNIDRGQINNILDVFYVPDGLKQLYPVINVP
jgi:hypothetical protein